MEWISALREFAGESGAWGVTATFFTGTVFLLRSQLGAAIEAYIERYRHRTKEITAKQAKDAEFTLDRLNGKLVRHLESSAAFASLLQDRIRESHAMRDVRTSHTSFLGLMEDLRERLEEHAREDVAAHERIAVVERDVATARQALEKVEERAESLRIRLEDKIDASTEKITDLILSLRWDRKTERRGE